MAKFPSIHRKHKPKEVGKWLRLKTISLLTNPTMFMNANSVFSDTARFIMALDSSWSHARSTSASGEPVLEMAAEAVRSNRLFFEPGNTNSILDSSKLPFDDCVALAVDTEDPFADFRRSMEEIVESCELKDWGHLEELLAWYLRMNREKNHVFIVGAFIDFVGSSSVFCSGCGSAP